MGKSDSTDCQLVKCTESGIESSVLSKAVGKHPEGGIVPSIFLFSSGMAVTL